MEVPKYLPARNTILGKPEAYAGLAIGSCLLAVGISMAPANPILGYVSATAGGIGILYGMEKIIY